MVKVEIIGLGLQLAEVPTSFEALAAQPWFENKRVVIRLPEQFTKLQDENVFVMFLTFTRQALVCVDPRLQKIGVAIFPPTNLSV